MLGQSVGACDSKTRGLRVGAMQSLAQTGGAWAKGEGAAGRLLHSFSIIEEELTRVKQILSHKTGDAERMELLEKLNSCKSIEYSRRRAKEFVEGAIAALAAVGDSGGNKALVETARFVAGRMV